MATTKHLDSLGGIIASLHDGLFYNGNEIMGGKIK